MTKFQVSDSLEFTKLENGDILMNFQGKCFIIDDSIWGSLVLTMTKFGERPNDWQEFMDHHHGRIDILEYAKKERLIDKPFASSVAEIAYQTLKNAGVECTRDQFRPAIQAFVTAEAASKRAYEEFHDKRSKGLA